MKYPTTEDEIAKEAIMAYLSDQHDGDEDTARKVVKQLLCIMELRDRGFTWTDI